MFAEVLVRDWMVGVNCCKSMCDVYTIASYMCTIDVHLGNLAIWLTQLQIQDTVRM